MINTICPHCGEVIEVEEGHTSWLCPKCKGFFQREIGRGEEDAKHKG